MAIILEPIVLPDSIDALVGVYYTGLGIKEQIGAATTIAESDLDNHGTVDLTRIAADGNAADAYTTFRATSGTKPETTLPIPESDGRFPLVRLATNLYASYLLVKHRIFGDVANDDVLGKKAVGLRAEAMALYAELFGGVDGSDPSKPKPGTFQTVPLVFDPECACDEFAG